MVPRRSNLVLAEELNRIRRQIRRQMYFPGESTRDKARRLFTHVSCTVGVFVNRKFKGADRVGVLLLDERDRVMLNEINAIMEGVEVTLRVADSSFSDQLKRELRHHRGGSPSLEVCPPSVPFSEFVARQQLLIISYNCWLNVTRNRSALISSFPSFMVVRPALKGAYEEPDPSEDKVVVE